MPQRDPWEGEKWTHAAPSLLLDPTLDPRAYAGLFRIVHWYNRTHVSQRRLLTCGQGVRLSPMAAFANAERITLGDRTRVGDHVHLWAGDREGRIIIGKDCLLGPGVFVTAPTTRSTPSRRSSRRSRASATS